MSEQELRQCPVCGVRALHWTDEPLMEEYEGRTYPISGFTYEACDACGETLLAGSQLDPVAIAVIAAARVDLGRLSSAQIHEMRHALGLTQAGLEAQLGVSAGTVGRWERGTVLQGATADRLMRILWAHPELLEESGLIAREGRGPYRTRK